MGAWPKAGSGRGRGRAGVKAQIAGWGQVCAGSLLGKGVHEGGVAGRPSKNGEAGYRCRFQACM